MINQISKPLIGIVTVLYNSDEVLPGFFKSLSSQEQVNIKLYVIDNSPHDAGVKLSEMLAKKFSIDVYSIFNDANVGVAKGNNQGIQLALKDKCDFILLANNDTEFEPQAIRNLLDVLIDTDEQVATPKIMYFDKPDTIWYAGGHINTWLMKTPHYGMLALDNGRYDSQIYVNYAPTCFMLFNAKVFETIGAMDEQYFVYYDDTDFVWRMSAKGIKIRFVYNSVVLHKVSSSTGGDRSPFSLYYTNRNRIYFIRKNLTKIKKVVALIYMMITRCFQILLIEKPLAKHIVRGVRDGFAMKIVRQ